MKAVYVKKSLCDCGFGVLRDEIPLGTVYNVDFLRQESMTLVCGQCQKEYRCTGVWCERLGDRHEGFLPLDLFEIDIAKTLAFD